MPSPPHDLSPHFSIIGELIDTIERDADDKLRDDARHLAQALLDLHREGITRILDIAGDEVKERCARDEALKHLLLLHGLHPSSLETRVNEALDSTRPYLKSHGGDIELLDVTAEGRVTLRLVGNCHGCPSSAVTLKLAVEDAIRESAPDVTEIVVEGSVDAIEIPRGGLAPARVASPDDRGLRSTWVEVPGVATVPAGRAHILRVDDEDVLFGRVGEQWYAYGPTCPACGATLDAAPISGSSLTCPACAARFDLAAAGRGLNDVRSHLEPVPLLVEDGKVRIAVQTVAHERVAS